jgi:uncharacterized protein with HEPN domain
MTDQAKKYLSDIIFSIGLIEQFTLDISDYSQYANDLKTQSAVERQLGIIGEAINKFERLNPDVSIENAPKIIGLRNRIIHAYDNIDSTIVWAILKKHLPPLKAEIESKLKP